jgi:hypothetical protein
MHQAYQTTPTQCKLWTPKWLASWIPIGKKLKHWKLSDMDVCPRHGEPEMHHHHVLVQYPQDEAMYRWTAAIDKLDRWLLLHHTQHNPHHQAMLKGLWSWYDQRPNQGFASKWPSVEDTIATQTDLEWQHFINRFTMESWLKTQQSYLESMDKKTTGKRRVS